MNPAGGIERVVSKHAVFFARNNIVTLLKKDTLESFYDLPTSVAIKSLKINQELNKKNRLLRIYQTIKQLFTARKELQSYKENYSYYYITHIRNLLELYLSGINLQKVIVTEHGSYYGYNIIYKKLKQWLYPKCNSVVVPTTMDYEIYKSQGCNAFYIANPLSFYNNKVSDLKEKVVINVGRLTSDKRHSLLLSIWKKLSLKHPQWKLKIVGKGELKLELEDQIKKNKMEDVVEIIEPIKNIEQFFLHSSIFAFTSKNEGFGMVLAEAMSCGVPCISFDVPSGPRDIIEDGVDGFLIKNKDENDYAEKLNLLISNFEKRIEMGENAKQNIRKFLDSKIEKEWISLLNKVKDND